MAQWQSKIRHVPQRSPKHMLVVSNCAWMFQGHNFEQALKHIVHQKQFPSSLRTCILNFSLELLDVGRKERSLGHGAAWIFNKKAKQNGCWRVS